MVFCDSENCPGPPTSNSKSKLPSPKPKCAAAARKLLRGSKRRRIDKFYRKQFNLVESFEQDSRQIQNYQHHKKQLQSQNSVRSGNSEIEQEEIIVENNHQQQQNGNGTENLPLIDANLMEEGEEKENNARILGEPTKSISIKSYSNGKNGSEEHYIKIAESICSTRRRSVQSSLNTGGTTTAGSKTLARRARKLAFFTLIVNVCLTLAKASASYLSGSLSIISSLVDSLVDITSGLVIWLTGRAIRKHDPYLYPIGRTRLEPVALVIVSVIMAVASVQMIVQSLESIVQHRIHPKIDWPTISIMLATVFIKLCLFFICNRFRNDPSTRVLAQDHRNDCLSNSIALLCAIGAQKFWLYLDPIGAIFVAFYIAITWFRTGREHLIMLSGRSAEPEFINRIIKVCIDHDARIEYIDTVYVYHFGTRFLVEVHVVLDQNMRLKEAHDISESLQNSIEALPDVERAFVHADYEFEHKPIDEHKIP